MRRPGDAESRDRCASESVEPGVNVFLLAPMTAGIRVLSAILLLVPVGLAVGVASGAGVLAGPLVLVAAIYGWIWLLFRPGAFVIHPDFVEVVWPLKRRTIPRAGILSCRILGVEELRREVGWGARVGAGGLWGGFGWLWTRRRGIVQMYISRTDAFVWIERGSEERPWLITPERPEEFVRELAPRPAPVVPPSPFEELVEKLRAHGFAVGPNDIETLLRSAWTTSSEFLGEAGQAVLRFQQENPTVAPDLRDALDRCMHEVRKVWPEIR